MLASIAEREQYRTQIACKDTNNKSESCNNQFPKYKFCTLDCTLARNLIPILMFRWGQDSLWRSHCILTLSLHESILKTEAINFKNQTKKTEADFRFLFSPVMPDYRDNLLIVTLYPDPAMTPRLLAWMHSFYRWGMGMPLSSTPQSLLLLSVSYPNLFPRHIGLTRNNSKCFVSGSDFSPNQQQRYK